MTQPTIQTPVLIGTGTTSATQSITITAGSNLMLMAVVHTRSGTCSGVTFGGIAMTLQDRQNVNSTDISVWYLMDAALDSNSLVGSAQDLIASGNGSNMTVQAVAMSGVAGSPFGTMVKGDGTSTTYSINVPNTANDIVFDAASGPGAGLGPTATSGATLYINGSVGPATRVRGYYKAGSGGTQTMSYSWQNSHAYNIVGFTVLGGTQSAAPEITSFTPLSGTDGTVVVITGTGFTGATAVEYYSPDAGGSGDHYLEWDFVVDSDTQITATVLPTAPPRASSYAGAIRVTTPGGSDTSGVPTFAYTPPNRGAGFFMMM